MIGDVTTAAAQQRIVLLPPHRLADAKLHGLTRLVSAVNLPAVPYGPHQDNETIVLDGGNDPIVAHAIAPDALAITRQRVAKASRVLAAGDPLAQIAQYAALGVRAELAQVIDSRAIELDLPGTSIHRRFLRVLICR